ncbi:MAG: DUF3352 domain-containing protein [Planctomycetota bacterium]|jgi:hypothetical protein
MKSPTRAVFTFCLITIICALSASQAKALPKAAKLLPPQTILLIEVDDFGKLKAQFEKTDMYKFYKEPAMVPFFDNVRAKWKEQTKEWKEDFILPSIINAGVLPQGRVAIAVAFKEAATANNKPLFLLLAQWGQNLEKIKETVDKTISKAVEGGSHRMTEDYRGVTIVTIIKELPPRQVPDFSNYSRKDNTPPPMKTVQPPPVKTYHCFLGDCLIGATEPELLKFVIAHIKGATSPTLADTSDYNSAIGSVGPHHDIDLYVNISQFVKTSITKDSTGNIQTVAANLGLNNVSSFSCAVGLAREPAGSVNGKAFLKINGAKKGIFKMLEPESAVFQAPRFMPALTYSMAFFNLNIKKAYAELLNILTASSPQLASILYTPLIPPTPDGQPGLELKSGIIDYLGSQIIIAQSVIKPFSDNTMPTESLYVLAVDDSTALEKSLSRLHDKMIASSDPEAKRELLGHTIYLLKVPPLSLLMPGRQPMQASDAQEVTQSPTMAFTITNTHLIFGLEKSVENAIRNLNNTESVPVASKKWFTTAKTHIPSVIGLSWLEDGAASGEALWWMIKEKQKASQTDAIMFGPLRVGQLLDPNLLPNFDVVRKYFSLSAFYGVSRPDGFSFELKDIKSPEND